MSEQINIIELDEEKAKTWYVQKHGLSYEEKEDLIYFNNYQEVLEWVYLDENNKHDDTIKIVRMISDIDVTKVVETGAKTIAEYLALQWERLEFTSYGFIASNI